MYKHHNIKNCSTNAVNKLNEVLRAYTRYKNDIAINNGFVEQEIACAYLVKELDEILVGTYIHEKP